MGDVAMLQVSYNRLRELWPDAVIRVLTTDEQAVKRFCPGAVPTSLSGCQQWNAEHPVLGGRGKFLPPRLRMAVGGIQRRFQRSAPTAALALLKYRNYRQGKGTAELGNFLWALTTSDLVLMCGQGSINDALHRHARQALGVLDWSVQMGIPTAVMGQGIGPLFNHELRKLASATLGQVRLIAVRERLTSPSILTSLGISGDRVRVTGDDAIELARSLTPARLGTGVGLSIRAAEYSNVARGNIDALQPALHQFANRHSAALVAIPIMRGTQTPDTDSIAKLCSGYEGAIRDGSNLDSPERTAAAVHHCRMVLTGTYHAAVFALAQGVPTVCIANSEYYAAKFSGLADQFGAGCTVILLDSADAARRLELAMRDAWHSADDIRPQLLAAADRQIATSRSAYRELVFLESTNTESAKGFQHTFARPNSSRRRLRAATRRILAVT